MISQKKINELGKINKQRKELFKAKCAYWHIKEFIPRTTEQRTARLARAHNVGKHYRRLKELNAEYNYQLKLNH